MEEDFYMDEDTSAQKIAANEFNKIATEFANVQYNFFYIASLYNYFCRVHIYVFKQFIQKKMYILF